MPPYPAISYIRKGVLVELHVTGMFYDDLSRRAQAIEAMNTKLASLPRVP